MASLVFVTGGVVSSLGKGLSAAALAAILESFRQPALILVTIPLALIGTTWALALAGESFTIFVIMGIVMMVGIVVNNAILIVHQSLNHIRDEGLAPREAIREAVRNRMRPIFMSVSTSTLGMLPLVLFPGAGSELYRGLGSVVVGGLVVSTLFTLFLVPALFSLTLDLRAALARTFAGATDDTA